MRKQSEVFVELEQLRQLVVIARAGTLQSAAEELHISQSALSRSVRRLEDDLGQPLFDRTRNSMQLNEAGRLALLHAREILMREQRMRDDFAALVKRSRTLRVASVAPAPTWRLSALVLECDPTAIIEPDIVSEDEASSRLLNGTCDLAVTAKPSSLPTIRSTKLMHEDLFANVPTGHELHGRSELTFSDLDGRDFLIYSQLGYWHQIHRAMLPRARFVTQSDRTIFLQQMRTSDLLTFTTNAPENTSSHVSRKAIPITDPEAHATFWLCMRTDAAEHIGSVFEFVRDATR